METIDIEKEDCAIECKKAKGGLTSSIWETYSAFCNTQGGVIYLGIDQINESTFVSSMLTKEEVEKLEKDFWSLINDPKKVSVNLLSNEDVSLCLYDGYPVLRIVVRRADREYRPVYINGNPLRGSYRRNHEGDYHCTPDEIKAMLRDASSGNQDLLCLEELGLDVLCEDSISSYWNRLSAIHPNHAFLKGDRETFLERLGAIRMGKDDKLHPTRAGLLMFGYDYKIVYEYPEYFLDYQKHKEEGEKLRWADRVISTSGDWSGNLFDFYEKIVSKLTGDLDVPFRLEGITRIDDTDMHAAVREALCNAISNADFYLKGGLVIHSYIDKIVLTNPGTMPIGIEQAYKGGESDARNKTILKMFNLVGVGERAGSGIPKIVYAAEERGYRKPEIVESFNPDKTKLTIYLKKDEHTIHSVSLKPSRPESKNEARKKIILAFINDKGPSGTSEIAKELGLSVSSAKIILHELVDEGLVVALGANKARRYALKK